MVAGDERSAYQDIVAADAIMSRIELAGGCEALSPIENETNDLLTVWCGLLLEASEPRVKSNWIVRRRPAKPAGVDPWVLQTRQRMADSRFTLDDCLLGSSTFQCKIEISVSEK